MLYDRAAMAGQGVLVAVAAGLIAAGCSGDEQQVGGCAGTAVLVTLMPSPAGAVADGGADADAAGACDDYLEALRVAIEAATPAACERRPLTAVLDCVPSSTSSCASDTFDANVGLEAQIRDYLGASWPEIEPGAVSLQTCVCHFN